MESIYGWCARSRKAQAMKKRPGIRQIEPNKFRLRVTTTDPTTGKRKELDRIVTAASIKEAQAQWDALHDELHQAAVQATKPPLVADYAQLWSERKSSDWKYSTALRAAEHLDMFVEECGRLRIDELTPKHINDWLQKLAKVISKRTKRPLSGHTRRGALRVVRTMLADAKAEYRLPFDPCERVEAPKVKQYTEEDPNALRPEQLAQMLTAMKATRLYALFATMAFTGLRPGEATALEWADVDFEQNTIRVKRTVYRGVKGDPKTEDSKRTVAMPPELVEILSQHRNAQIRDQVPGLSRGLCFPSTTGGYLDNSTVNKTIHKAAGSIGLTFRLTAHGLRRTLNTLAVRVAPGEVVRKVLGHSTVAMTEHYTAADMADKRQIAEGVVKLVRGVTGNVGISGGDPANPPEGCREGLRDTAVSGTSYALPADVAQG